MVLATSSSASYSGSGVRPDSLPARFFGLDSRCGEREGRNILCVERHINDNRHGASYD